MRKSIQLIVCILMLWSFTTQVFASEDYVVLMDNLHISREVYQQLNDSETIEYPLFRTIQKDKSDVVVSTILQKYTGSEIKGSEEEPFAYAESIELETEIGKFYLTDDDFLDALSIFYERDEKYTLLNMMSSEVAEWSLKEGKRVGDEAFSFLSRKDAIALVKDFLDSISIGDDGVEFSLEAISRQNFEDFEQYYNENFAEEIKGQIKSDYENVYVVKGYRKLEGMNFLTDQQEIGNVESGANVIGEGYRFIVGEQGLLSAEIINHFFINTSQKTGTVVEDKQKLLALIQHKFNNLLIVDNIYIDAIETFYAPYPIENGNAQKRDMEYQPIWRVDTRIENGRYEENNPASPQFFELPLYFNIQDNKEILH